VQCDIDDCILDSDLTVGRESIKTWTCNYRQKGISMLGLFLFMTQSVTHTHLILSVSTHTHTLALCVIKISPASVFLPGGKHLGRSQLCLLSVYFISDGYP